VATLIASLSCMNSSMTVKTFNGVPFEAMVMEKIMGPDMVQTQRLHRHTRSMD
jgi:hypothetical protein